MVRNRRYALCFVPDGKIKAAFIEPMLLLRTEKLPKGPDVVYELFYGFERSRHKSVKPSQFNMGRRPILIVQSGSASSRLFFEA